MTFPLGTLVELIHIIKIPVFLQPISNSTTVIYNVYNLNNPNFSNYTWQGLKNIWKLNTSPRSKFFIWTLLQGQVKTLIFFVPFVVYTWRILIISSSLNPVLNLFGENWGDETYSINFGLNFALGSYLENIGKAKDK